MIYVKSEILKLFANYDIYAVNTHPIEAILLKSIFKKYTMRHYLQYLCMTRGHFHNKQTNKVGNLPQIT